MNDNITSPKLTFPYHSVHGGLADAVGEAPYATTLKRTCQLQSCQSSFSPGLNPRLPWTIALETIEHSQGLRNTITWFRGHLGLHFIEVYDSANTGFPVIYPTDQGQVYLRKMIKSRLTSRKYLIGELCLRYTLCCRLLSRESSQMAYHLMYLSACPTSSQGYSNCVNQKRFQHLDDKILDLSMVWLCFCTSCTS